MRKLIVSSYVTLDGRVDDIRGWALPYDDAGAADYHADLLSTSDGLLLGRKTYEVFAATWPLLSGQVPYIDRLNAMAKHVVSTTLTDLHWENSYLVQGEAADGVAELKRQPGQDLVMYGCHDLMRSLAGHDLIDEYRAAGPPGRARRGSNPVREQRAAAEPHPHRHHRHPTRNSDPLLPADAEPGVRRCRLNGGRGTGDRSRRYANGELSEEQWGAAAPG